MNLLSVFIQGLTLGLAYLAPIGMQNLFAINSALAPISNRLGGKINERALTWVNRICGIVITLYGLKLLSTLVQL